MAKIQGIYTLRAALYKGGDPSDRDLYQYQDNDRNAQILFSQNCDLDFQQLDPENPANLGEGRCFPTQAILKIKRARIVTPGSSKLQPANGSLAAHILLSTYGFDADNNRVSGQSSWLLNLDFYNEWQDLNLNFSCFKGFNASDHYYFTILGQAVSYMTVDDYNIQAAYKNEYLRAFIEMQVDCAAGLLTTSDFSVV